MSGFSQLHPAQFLDSLGPTRLGRPVVLFDRVRSTNETAITSAAGGAPEGLLIVAEEQTAGRGRKGRSWHSMPGKSLTFSILLRPPAEHAGLTALLGLAAARVLDCYADDIAIKWPNDIFCRGRKLGGILAEAREGAVAMGMGINVNEDPGDFPAAIARRAISLRMVCGEEQHRGKLLGLIVETFDDLYRQWRSEGFDFACTEIESRLLYLAERVVLETGDGRAEGIMIGITAEGYLRIADGGRERVFASGDLSLRRARRVATSARGQRR